MKKKILIVLMGKRYDERVVGRPAVKGSITVMTVVVKFICLGSCFVPSLQTCVPVPF